MADIIVVGGGPAGLTAALYSARAGKSVIVIEKLSPGGQITYAPHVENYPGLPGMSGASYAEALIAQAESFGVKILSEEVLDITPGDEITVTTDCGTHICKCVILAVGTEHKSLGISGEEDLIGAGISYCAVCDGAFYSSRDVTIVGGGNTALQEALFLSDICKSVTLVHRREAFRADDCLVNRLKDRQNINILTPYVVSDIREKDGELCGLVLTNKNDGTTLNHDTDGVFVAIGNAPQTEPFKSLGLCDASGYFASDESTKTKIPGIFVAGDCRAKSVRQLTTACADGTMAAMAACDYLDK